MAALILLDRSVLLHAGDQGLATRLGREIEDARRGDGCPLVVRLVQPSEPEPVVDGVVLFPLDLVRVEPLGLQQSDLRPDKCRVTATRDRKTCGDPG